MPEDLYGKTAPGKTVQFPGELNAGPRSHMPGRPVAAEALSSRSSLVAGNTVATTRTITVEGSSVQFKRLVPEASLPVLGSSGAAGYDLVTPAAITLKAGERTTIPLGFALGLPARLHARIESRSGLALKGLVVLTGVIDEDYRGELKVIMQNFSSTPYEFAAGDRVAQLVLRPTIHAPFEVVETLSETGRGTGGFGSTGA